MTQKKLWESLFLWMAFWITLPIFAQNAIYVHCADESLFLESRRNTTTDGRYSFSVDSGACENQESSTGGGPIFDNYPWLTDYIVPSQCMTEKVALYQSGVYTYLLVTDAQGVEILYNQDGQFYCQNASNYDCVLAYNLGTPIAIWDCQSSSEQPNDDCSITIVNGQCRPVDIYDGANNYLTTIRGKLLTEPDQPALPPFEWVDTRPLDNNGGRTYVFKIGNLEIGRQTASCANTTIPVVSAYRSGCISSVSLNSFTNTGCQPLIFTNIHGGGFTLVSGETKILTQTFPKPIWVILVNTDTLDIIDAEANSRRVVDIDSGGCGEGGSMDVIFERYPWLSTKINLANCSTEKIAVYQQGSYFYLLVTDAEGLAILYNQDGQFYCQNAHNYDCVAAYNLGEPIDLWTCGAGNSNCDCPSTISPVCGVNGISYNNACEAACAGVEVSFNSSCNIFEAFGWLSDKINLDDCQSIKVDIYEKDHIKYLLVSYGSGREQLYNHVGATRCQKVNTLALPSCAVRNELGDPIATWTCNGTTMPPVTTITTCDLLSKITLNPDLCAQCYKDISVYEYLGKAYLVYTAQHNTCIDARVRVVDCETGVGYCLDGGSGAHRGCPDFLQNAKHVETILEAECPAEEGCRENIGTILFRTCDNGELYYFILTDDGEYLDPYFDTSVSYEPIDGQRVYFEYTDATFLSPCSIAKKAINVSCIEKADTGNPATRDQCSAYNGVVISEPCDDGTNYFFIQATSGRFRAKLDPYLAEGIDYRFVAGQTVKFTFKYAHFDSPCSTADRAAIITCIEVTGETTSNNTVFEEYPFLSTKINQNNCTGTSIEVFDRGSYAFIFVRTSPNTGTLYFDDGSFYCSSTSTYDCLAAYRLSTPTSTWSCNGNLQEPATERAKSAESLKGFIAYPNPTTGTLQIQLPSLPQTAQLNIHNLFGQQVRKQNLATATAPQTLMLDISDYENGIYYLTLQMQGKRSIERIVKQELR